MDTLQWMGAVRMRVQTADKNITIIHKWSHRLTYYEVECNLNCSRLSADFIFGWTIPSFLSSVEHKIRYFEECCQPNSFGTYIDSYCMDKTYYGSQYVLKLLGGQQHSSKYHRLCSTEEQKSYRNNMWGSKWWQNFQFEWILLLNMKFGFLF